MRIVRIGDVTTGHGCFPSQNVLTGKPTILVNGIPISTIGDQISSHACGASIHSSTIATGSKTVRANNLPIARIGDTADCSSLLATGSLNVSNQDLVKTFNFVKLDSNYSKENLKEISKVGASAAFDDEASIGNKPAGMVDGENPNVVDENAKTDDKPVSTESAVDNIKNDASGNLQILIIEMDKAGIKDFSEQAMFLAQLDVESGGFTRLVENRYSADGVYKRRGETLAKYGVTIEQVRADYKSKGAEYMFEYLYADRYREERFRLGNNNEGDGVLYKGRGFIQISGKSNYITSGKSLSLDLLNKPDLAAQPDIATKIAIEFWVRNKCKEPAIAGNVTKVTKIINGGDNGLNERKKKYANYLYDAKQGKFTMPLKEIVTPKQNTVVVDEKEKDTLSTALNTQLSEHFTLADLSTKAVFSHKVKAQQGFTEKQIVYNLKCVAVNILEKIYVKYPIHRVNNGFRSDTKSKSQHESGMAVDLQWPGISNKEYLERAKWIRDNLVYDQLIFEHGISIWLHISFDPYKKVQRNQVLTMYKDDYTHGLTLYYK